MARSSDTPRYRVRLDRDRLRVEASSPVAAVRGVGAMLEAQGRLSARYGDFHVRPISGALRVAQLHFDRSAESAAPVYLRVGLRDGEGRVTLAEVAATRLAGFSRLTFPASVAA